MKELDIEQIVEICTPIFMDAYDAGNKEYNWYEKLGEAKVSIDMPFDIIRIASEIIFRIAEIPFPEYDEDGQTDDNTYDEYFADIILDSEDSRENIEHRFREFLVDAYNIEHRKPTEEEIREFAISISNNKC